MTGASYSRPEATTAARRLRIGGRADAHPRVAQFQNMDEPYDSWGPYGPGGRAEKLLQWVPENIDRLSVSLQDAPF